MDSISQLQQAERLQSIPLLESLLDPPHPTHIRISAAISLSNLIQQDHAVNLLKQASKFAVDQSHAIKLKLAEGLFIRGERKLAFEIAPEGDFKGHLFRARILLEMGIGGDLLEKEIDAAKRMGKNSPLPNVIKAQARLAGILQFNVEEAAKELSEALWVNSRAAVPMEDQERLKCMVDLAHCYAHPNLKKFEKCASLASAIIQLLQAIKGKTMLAGIAVTDLERKMIEILERNKFVVPEMLFLRAGSYFEMKKFKEALADFIELEQVLSLNQDMHISALQKKQISVKKAMCFAQIGELYNAIQESTRYLNSVQLDLEQRDADMIVKALDIRGTCFYRLSQLEKSLADFKAACSFRPVRQDIYEKYERIANVDLPNVQKTDSSDVKQTSKENSPFDLKMIQEAEIIVAPLAMHILSIAKESGHAVNELIDANIAKIMQEMKNFKNPENFETKE
jgi:tetratricopeptide (TPR) repeat protein